jgi:hypothetical protein
MLIVYPDPKNEPRRPQRPQRSDGIPFRRGKVTMARCEEFTRFVFGVFEVFAVQFSSWAENLPAVRMAFEFAEGVWLA